MIIEGIRDYDWFYGRKERKGSLLGADIETNGLMPEVDKLHSLVLEDLETGEMLSCGSGIGCAPLKEGLGELSAAGVAFLHNGLRYDIPVLRHLVPGWDTKAVIIDTLVLSKMIWPTDKLKDLDWPRWRRAQAAGKPELFPGNLVGAHALEAWGYRLGEMKGDYSKTVKEWSKRIKDGEPCPQDFLPLLTEDGKLDPWKAWNKPMQDYCEQDVRVTSKFLNLILQHLTGQASAAHGVSWSPGSVALEHGMWQFCMDLEERGFGYDIKTARQLTAHLKNEKQRLEDEIRKGFGSWWQPLSDVASGETPKADRRVAHLVDGEPLPDVTIPRYGAGGKPLKPYVGPPKASYTTDAPFVKVERKELNPGSARQLGDRLIAVYGWQPSEWVGLKDENGKGVQAKLDETVLDEIDASVLPVTLKDLIMEFLVVKKTLGMVEDGKKSWNTFYKEQTGRIHGRIDPLGTVSHRGAHKDPNLGQVPSVSVDEIKKDGVVVSKEPILGWKGGFGWECRSLFRPGLITRLGNPGFKRQTGIDASGLQLRGLGHHLAPYDGGKYAKMVSTPGVDVHAENGKLVQQDRKGAKKVVYTWLFGAGPPKIGITLGLEDGEEDQYWDTPAVRSYVKFMQRVSKGPYDPDRRMKAFIGKGSDAASKLINGIDGLKDLRNDLKAYASEHGFIQSLDGGRLHVRKPHAVLNQALQGDEAIICKTWLLETRRLLTEVHKLREDWDFGCMGWVHDEAQYEHQEGLDEVMAAAGAQAMTNTQEMLGYKCPLATEAKHGENWAICH